MESSSKGKEILIIGGGIAGLAAGVYAQKNGYKATILEQNDRPGGQLTAWERNGYKFDFCLQWLVGTNHGVYHDMWKEIGAIRSKSETATETEVINHDVFVEMVDERGQEGYGKFFIFRDIDQWETYLVNEVAPEDSKAIRKLCRMIKKSGKFEQFTNPPGLRSWLDYVRQLYKCWRFFPVVAKYGKMTAKELFDDLGLKNDKLRFFLTQFGTLDPVTGADVTAVGLIMMLGFQHDKNAGYLKGGSQAMCQRVRDTFEKAGGKFRFNAKAAEIIVEGGDSSGSGASFVRGVKLENGERLLADRVISACDGHTVLYEMLGNNNEKYTVPNELKKPYEEWSVFTPMVMVVFGVDGTIVSDAHDVEFVDSKKKIQIGRTMTDGYNIMNRSMYDGTFAPTGKTALQIEFLSPWGVWKDLSDTQYAQEKQAVKNRCLELLERHYPGISEKIEVVDVATPRTTVRYTGVWKGAFEGFIPAVENIGTNLPMEVEGLEGFYMAGQWVMPGGGLPPSAQSGRWIIQKLTKKDKRRFKH